MAAIKDEKFTLTTASLMSDEDIQVYCQPCDEDGPRIPAHGYCTDCNQHLCKTCLTVHKKHKLSKHHTLLDATGMPTSLQEATSLQGATSSQQPTSLINTSKPFDLTKPCPKHANEKIKFYCHDHKELLCIVCVDQGHLPAVCEVSFIPDISGDIIDSIEYKLIMRAIDKIADKYQSIERDARNMIGKSNSTLRDALADIRKYRKEINGKLNDLERDIENAVKTIEQDNNKTLKAVETTCENMKKSLNTSLDAIKKFNTEKHADKLFIQLKLAEKIVADAEKKTPQLKSYDVKRHKFNRNGTIFTQLNKERYLGTLTYQTLNMETAKSVQIPKRNVARLGEICVKTSKDKSKCRIKGMTIFTPELLVITDSNNKAIKMVDTGSHSVIHQLKLKSKPFDITKVTYIDLAVTIPDKHLVHFIKISSNQLTMKHAIDVGGQCWGIDCHQDKLVVSFWNPATVKILTMKGNLLASIEKDILSQPRHITTNSKFIFVSNSGMKAATKLSWQGEVICWYDGMEKLKGLALSGDGTLFACDKRRNVIEEITEDCMAGKFALTDLRSPYAITWCAESKRMFYSCYAGSKIDNCIYIYKAS